jgi:hypothetical protein
LFAASLDIDVSPVSLEHSGRDPPLALLGRQSRSSDDRVCDHLF